MRGTADLGISASAAVNSVSRLVPIGDQGRDVLARFERIALGDRLPALLRANLGDGSFEVELAGTQLRMALPPGMQAGQRIELTLLAREPRLTFSLQGNDQGKGGVQAQVSSAGRLIDTLLRPELAEDGATHTPPKALVEAARPVASTPITQATQLAQALANTLATSGLFYESHVAQWVNGGRSEAQLQQEPQYNWTEKNLARPHPQPERAATIGPAQNAATDSAGSANSASQSAAPAAGELPMDPASEAAQMLRLQLETLEHNQVLWRGEAWPGLPMEWGVADGGGHAEAAERDWQSVLRFHFDRLGTVSATLNLSGGEVRLSLRTESEGIAQRLRGAATGLADALQAAGTPLHQMSVRREDKS